MPVRSVAKADVAELAAVLDASVEQEPDHHLVVVAAKQSLSTTQFKQMFYSRGDDFFQIANVYECPDSANSVRSSVWGIDPNEARHSVGGNVLYTGDDGTTEGGTNSTGEKATIGPGGTDAIHGTAHTTAVPVYNFNKLGGRHDDPTGTQHAYGYAHDPSRSFFAQHEVMGFLEQDVCVKRDNWTACSRMSIEDQLYSLAFASETDQDLCLKVTCARRWSEVEDALAESCTAADTLIGSTTSADPQDDVDTTPARQYVDLFINVRVTNGHPKALDTILRVRFHVEYRTHQPSVRNTWNTRASTAAAGVIQSGVVGDAPEGGKEQHEDTTVVVA